MKKGHRRKQSKAKRKALKLSPNQISRVHKARKKLHKNPAFKNLTDSPISQSLKDAMCDMAVLSLLKTMGVSSQSILEIMLPMVSEVLQKQGSPAPTEIPIGMGISIGLTKKPEA